MGQKRDEEEDQVLITDISTGSVGQKKRQKYSFGVPEFRLPEAPNFPIGSDYSAYVNPVAAHDFLDAIQDVVQQRLFDNIRESLFFSVLVDESTDHGCEQHLIIYMVYLLGGKELHCDFLKLLQVCAPEAENDLSQDHWCALRSSPRAKDGFTTNQPIFDAIDKLAQKIKSWLGKSSLRHKELKELLQSYCLKELKMLAMHDVRWLSRGEVMQWLVIAMPALLDQWKIADKTQYSSLTTIQVQFFIHLLADVLAELNKLNVLFQAQMTNYLEIVSFLDMTIETLKGHKG
ncbi:hypothetical protein SELMODRAFT_427615 [Selaginella moellendorffii]|uniref:DUF4371 domain-containing protein n=1 Tax=Selaginella moellendorffii TaxID=88036 RepID=D8T064_SELML|nr:hypothetical protein SELMODRAFT_427615 [Selaginella moellendorffii]